MEVERAEQLLHEATQGDVLVGQKLPMEILVAVAIEEVHAE